MVNIPLGNDFVWYILLGVLHFSFFFSEMPMEMKEYPVLAFYMFIKSPQESC